MLKIISILFVLVGLLGCGGTSDVCTPDEYFCDGTQIRQCTNDGKSSILNSDCATQTINVACSTCQVCEGSYPVCVSDVPICIGEISGIVNQVINSNTCGSGCGGQSGCFSQIGVFSNTLDDGSYISVSPWGTQPVSGAVYDLHATKDIPNPAFMVTIGNIKGKPLGFIYRNSINSFEPAPVGGTIQVGFQGTNAGDGWSIEISGYLGDDDGIWKEIKYSASGVFNM